MGRHTRSGSFALIDEHQASGLLADILRENNVYLGGASVGKGLRKAAQFHLQKDDLRAPKEFMNLPGAQNLAEKHVPIEEPFYVVDIGVIVSQVYQWRRYFPRVEPFYAVKCNPDPVLVQTLAVLGCNFDCASRAEIRLVQECAKDLPRKPDIIYANPCKARAHLMEAICRGVELVTFDNATEVAKCASISKNIKLILRIITDDRGSQCRLSSKFGAPRIKWRPLLAAARHHGLEVVGVSFHVGSGCRDASRYEDALKDAREIFDMAEKDFGMKMTILDIGGGFPGETHGMWNPAVEIDEDRDHEGKTREDIENEDRFMYFTEIAEQVAPVLDTMFPPESGIRVIAEPGRYLVAAAATLCCTVVSTRSNEYDTSFVPEPTIDAEASKAMNDLTRNEETDIIHRRTESMSRGDIMEDDSIMNTIKEELADYSKLYATQQFSQQEFDVYNDNMDIFKEGFSTASDILGPPSERQFKNMNHTVEGLNSALISAATEDDIDPSGMLTLAAAGEAAVSGMVMQAVADAGSDDYAYYINDGCYGGFNSIIFDHAIPRPRVLKTEDDEEPPLDTSIRHGLPVIEEKVDTCSEQEKPPPDRELFATTLFGPTCDSIDVVARSVLLPKLKVGDWLYFQNMGAYTMAAASDFNGFSPSERFYVCSVQPEYFEALIKGPEDSSEEKKEE